MFINVRDHLETSYFVTLYNNIICVGQARFGWCFVTCFTKKSIFSGDCHFTLPDLRKYCSWEIPSRTRVTTNILASYWLKHGMPDDISSKHRSSIIGLPRIMSSPAQTKIAINFSDAAAAAASAVMPSAYCLSVLSVCPHVCDCQ